MRGLNREARGLIEAAARESSGEPTAADRARVKQLLMLQLGAGAAAGAGTVGMAVAKAAKLALLSKLLLPTAVVALAAAGGSWAYQSYQQRNHAAVSRTARRPPMRSSLGPARGLPAQSARELAAAPGPSDLDTATDEPSGAPVARSVVSATNLPGRGAAHVDRTSLTPVASATVQRGDEQPSEPTESGGDRQASAKGALDAETRLLRQAHADIRAGNPKHALDRLDEYDQRFGHGLLRAEQQAARVLALCQMGRKEEARSLAQAFLERWPRSPLVPRVRAACMDR